MLSSPPLFSPPPLPSKLSSSMLPSPALAPLGETNPDAIDAAAALDSIGSAMAVPERAAPDGAVPEAPERRRAASREDA